MLGLVTKLLQILGICAMDIQSFPGHPDDPRLSPGHFAETQNGATPLLLTESSGWSSSLTPGWLTVLLLEQVS